MPHRFKKGDQIFYTPKEQELQAIRGMYLVDQVSNDGTIYRIIDAQGEYTDADEGELQEPVYAVFVTVQQGWPIIVPTHHEDLYNQFLGSSRYKFHLGGPAAICVKEQLKILRELEEKEGSD